MHLIGRRLDALKLRNHHKGGLLILVEAREIYNLPFNVVSSDFLNLISSNSGVHLEFQVEAVNMMKKRARERCPPTIQFCFLNRAGFLKIHAL